MSQTLGRGLSSLIPKKTIDRNASSIVGANLIKQELENSERIFQIDPALIEVNPYQPRHNFSEISLQELVDSIKKFGIMQPLIATKKGDKYQLIAGERRWRSANIAKLSKVPVIVREADEQTKLELALIENLQRQNLDLIETARAYRRLMEEFKLSQEETAKRVSKARSTVANTLRLLELPEEIQKALSSGRISEAHAKYILGVSGETKQLILFKKIIHQNLSVAQTHEEIKRTGGTKMSRVKINYADEAKEKQLRAFFATKVKINRKKKGGRIQIDFYSEEELDNILEKLG